MFLYKHIVKDTEYNKLKLNISKKNSKQAEVLFL